MKVHFHFLNTVELPVAVTAQLEAHIQRMDKIVETLDSI
jgi:hypothetical protein